MSPRAAVLAGLVLAAGCGGSGPSPNGVPIDFAAKAMAVCEHAHELKLAQGPFPLPAFNPTNPDASMFPEVAVALQKTANTWQTWLAEMQALGVPLTGQAPWADLVAAVERHRNLNADQIAAAMRSDRKAFADDYSAGMKTQADLLRAATAAGVPDCAKVDR